RERLPDLTVKTAALDLVDHDPVGFSQDLKPLGVDLAQAADRQTGTWEGLAVDHLFGHAELQSDRADLVLEEVAQRLDQLEPQAPRQATDAVMRLDLRPGPGPVRGRWFHY